MTENCSCPNVPQSGNPVKQTDRYNNGVEWKAFHMCMRNVCMYAFIYYVAWMQWQCNYTLVCSTAVR